MINRLPAKVKAQVLGTTVLATDDSLHKEEVP